MDDSQLLKGILEGCILALIAKGETYGYEINARLSKCGFANICEGTLYPVLSRLEKNGDIVCRKEKSPFGPIRKYYKISPKGEENLKCFRILYFQLESGVHKIFEEE